MYLQVLLGCIRDMCTLEKRAERSPYIAERAQGMHNLTRDEMLQRSHKDRRGVCVPYQEKDLRYDVTQGYLRKEGAGQVRTEGVLHRGSRVLARRIRFTFFGGSRVSPPQKVLAWGTQDLKFFPQKD